MPKRKARAESPVSDGPRFVVGPIKSRSTWPTRYSKRDESRERLSKPGHYVTHAAFQAKGAKGEGRVFGPKSAMEDSEFGARAELLMFPNGTIRIIAVPYPCEAEVDEDGVATGGWVSVCGPCVQGRMGVSKRFGRSILTPLLDGRSSCGGEGYETPYPLKLELKVLEPGQEFKVEQCPHEVHEWRGQKRKDIDADGMKKIITGAGDLVVTFNFPGEYPVVNYMRRKHETPTHYLGHPMDENEYEDFDIEQEWFC